MGRPGAGRRFDHHGGNQLGVSTVPRGGSFAAGLPSVAAADVTVKHGLRLPSITSAKLGLYETTEMRRQADGDRYQATLTVGAGGALSLSADRAVDGQSTQLAKVALPLKATSNGWLTVETKVSARRPSRCRPGVPGRHDRPGVAGLGHRLQRPRSRRPVPSA